jgi:hypothetical protein
MIWSPALMRLEHAKQVQDVELIAVRTYIIHTAVSTWCSGAADSDRRQGIAFPSFFSQAVSSELPFTALHVALSLSRKIVLAQLNTPTVSAMPAAFVMPIVVGSSSTSSYSIDSIASADGWHLKLAVSATLAAIERTPAQKSSRDLARERSLRLSCPISIDQLAVVSPSVFLFGVSLFPFEGWLPNVSHRSTPNDV